eukprot:CAMPEP_0176173088 /NCGR_PEP_ID=MMETSP0120_2-20121206/88685_1 /TAXON_ID=160619 /ORGANISM="Kryptoperidinium foliaceum, Strain CCMP 1326" /LENGTH=59 /DNA_ID=CAMNT_0017511103 /DNA_START=176 /DNA_END=355 /DNA_ORIENTATION=-
MEPGRSSYALWWWEKLKNKESSKPEKKLDQEALGNLLQDATSLNAFQRILASAPRSYNF